MNLNKGLRIRGIYNSLNLHSFYIMTSVILQPVNLIKIAEIIDDKIELSWYVKELLHSS